MKARATFLHSQFYSINNEVVQQATESCNFSFQPKNLGQYLFRLMSF
jgi:hypothetical protein